jgi:hypothetical protein
LRERIIARNAVLGLLWVFCAITVGSSIFRFRYDEIEDWRLKSIACLKGYYKNGGEARCPQAHPSPLKLDLDRARELQLSFYREMMEK